MTKAQVDKLGDRLRADGPIEPDQRLLDEYRTSFRSAYEEVMWVLQERSHGRLEPTGRFPKTQGSIVAKLAREPSIRLSQIQDIAGCRIVVPSFEDQIVALMAVEGYFPDESTRVVDRRDQPSHGYRAVHVVVSVRRLLVEIQIRTSLQHLWAELCEKFADHAGGDIKYGGGPDQIRGILGTATEQVAAIEDLEQSLFRMDAEIDTEAEAAKASRKSEISDFRELIEQGREKLTASLRKSIALLQRAKLDRGNQ